MDFDRLIPTIRLLALEAGDRIMEVYNGPDFEVKAKGDASPVTVADEAADALISAGLRAAFPDVVLITEEQAASHALSAKTFLIVDQLDGTKEFVQRRGDFTVNIAYVQDRVPLDPFNGIKDLERKNIQTPLAPDQTFSDDPLRMMRAIRFASQLNFNIEQKTFDAIGEDAGRHKNCKRRTHSR